jgi:hypothetical protein
MEIGKRPNRNNQTDYKRVFQSSEEHKKATGFFTIYRKSEQSIGNRPERYKRKIDYYYRNVISQRPQKHG